MKHKILSYAARSGRLTEYYGDGGFSFSLETEEGVRDIPLYTVKEELPAAGDYYLGYTLERITASGRDLLAEAVLAEGEPDYRRVKEILPPLKKDTYALLGGVASIGGLTVGADGRIFPQLSGRDRDPRPSFHPASYDGVLGAIPPRQMLVGGEYPLLLSLHRGECESLEFLYFVEPTEPDRDPICWIRAKRYKNASPADCSISYLVAAIAREATEEEQLATPPSEEIFLDALLDTLTFWVGYAEGGVRYTLPEGELARIAQGATAMAAITMTAGHAHYGHRFYGKELHDNFPPNYIFAIEAAVRSGRHGQAREIFRHFVKYVLRNDGKINYRQGKSMIFGASAAEYGMLLSQAWEYRHILATEALAAEDRRRLIGMGEELVSHIGDTAELEGRPLIRMCAEADTNERIHVYLNNNLWAIRGLSALAALLGREGARFRAAADTLTASVDLLLTREVTVSRFGPLPPFRLGYTATPMTLSRCEDTYAPLEGEARRRYFSTLWERQDVAVSEDIAENAFANYRYYPEMLSSHLLPSEQAEAIARMREALGGELLGMTRFLNRIDDWPVMHYARYLIESGRIEKYLLLLFAHAAHHGDTELLTYYEQVSADGAVIAFDCLPSLLTVPILLAWAFAYEAKDGCLRLLSALPRAWYRLPFRAEGVGYSGGRLSIRSDGDALTVSFCEPLTVPAELCLRGAQGIGRESIAAGGEWVSAIRGSTLLLAPGCTGVTVCLH